MAGQSKRLASIPVQRILSSHMGELAEPNGYEPLTRIIPPAAAKERENKIKGSIPLDGEVGKTRVN